MWSGVWECAGHVQEPHPPTAALPPHPRGPSGVSAGDRLESLRPALPCCLPGSFTSQKCLNRSAPVQPFPC